jgi:CDP-diacylglycerol--serine O-phosphatidyltransferase
MIRKNIPNFVTLLNLLSGCVSIVFAFSGELRLASYLIGMAAIFDFLDGTLARVLKVRSEIGLQLDSLADVISFGLAPGFIIFHLMNNSSNAPLILVYNINFALFVALLIPVFSAFRLAKFNIDYRQNENFIGMPTPTSAIFFASLPLVLHQASVSNHTMVKSLIENYWVLSLLVIVFSYLMVSSVVLMSLKFKTLSFTANSTRYIFLFVALVLVLFLKFYAFPIVILFYILLSFLFNPAKRSIISKRQGANHS